MMAVSSVKLKEVCSQDRQTIKAGEHNDLKYIGIETIEANSGLFIDGELSKTPEIPKANSFRFGRQHILYGKLRPYLNKVALPDFEGKCSTEIIPLLPKSSINRAYLAYFLRSSQIVSQITAKTAGSRMPRADMNFVLNLEIPLLPLIEQNRIIDILSRAEGIVRLRRDAQKKAEEIIPALFLDMFGDPATNPKGWPVSPLGELCDLVRGSSPRPQGDARFFGGPVPRLMIADITRDGTFVTPQIDSLTIEGAKRSRPMNAGDVVMAVSGAVGLSAILTIDACIHDGFVGFRALKRQHIVPLFLYNFLTTLRNRAEHEAVGAIFQNLKTDQIKRWRIPLVPLDLQENFVIKTNQVHSIQLQQVSATQKAEATFSALLARIFN